MCGFCDRFKAERTLAYNYKQGYTTHFRVHLVELFHPSGEEYTNKIVFREINLNTVQYAVLSWILVLLKE